MKRMLYMTASVLGLALMISGCGAQKPAQEIVSKENPEELSADSEVDVLSGRYIMEHEDEGEVRVPTLWFYKDHKFSFTWSVLSSYYAFGTYEIQGQDVILKTDDGAYEYIFRAEEDSLIFDQDRSSEVKTYEGDLEVTDGAVFLPEGDLIAQNISFTLPEGLTADSYDFEIGYSGGCLLLPEAYEEYEKDVTPPEWVASGSIFRFPTDMITWDGDTIERVDVYWNHTNEEVLGSVPGMEAPAYMTKMQHDLYTAAGLSMLEESGEKIPEDTQSEYWYIFMANPGDEFGYAVSLNTKNFEEEDILQFAGSVKYIN